MKRKVIQIANSTQLISLPRKWAKKFNIKKGDEIEVEERGSELAVSTEKGVFEERAKIDASKLGNMIKRFIAASYKAGYDEIEILYSSIKELQDIQEVIKETCIGFEIIEQGHNRVLAKQISSTIYKEFGIVLRRTFLFIISRNNDCLSGIKDNDYNKLKSIILSDDSIDRFTDFCRRILNKRGYEKEKRTAPLYYIIEELEKIGDVHTDICNFIIEKKIKMNKELINIYSDLNRFFEMFYELFYNFKLEKLNQFYEFKLDIQKKIINNYDKISKKEYKLLELMEFLMIRIYDMNGPLIASLLK